MQISILHVAARQLFIHLARPLIPPDGVPRSCFHPTKPLSLPPLDGFFIYPARQNSVFSMPSPDGALIYATIRPRHYPCRRLVALLFAPPDKSRYHSCHLPMKLSSVLPFNKARYHSFQCVPIFLSSSPTKLDTIYSDPQQLTSVLLSKGCIIPAAACRLLHSCRPTRLGIIHTVS